MLFFSVIAGNSRPEKMTSVGEFFPVTKKKRPGYVCAVFNCSNNPIKCPDLQFHSLPKEGKSAVYLENQFGVHDKYDRYRAWKKILRMERVTSSMRVCSEHFTKEDYTACGKGENSGKIV